MKTQWLATRTLHDLTDPSKKYEVQLGFPEPQGKGLWRCVYRVWGLGTRKTKFAIGCDALQAITVALDGLALQLRESKRSFRWIDLPGETGVRRQIPIFLGFAFADSIEAHIEASIEEFAKEAEKKVAGKRALGAKKKP